MTFLVEYSLAFAEEGAGDEFRRKFGEADLFGFVLKGFLLPVICASGVIGNFLSVVVLCQKEMRTAVNCFFLGLAVSDGLFLLAQFLVFGVYNFAKYFGIWAQYRFQYDPILTQYLIFLTVTGQMGGIYFTLAITVDRFIVVYYPLQAKRICSWRRAGATSILIVFFSLFSGLPNAFGLEAYRIPEDEVWTLLDEGKGTNETLRFQAYDYRYSEWGKSVFFQQYIHWGRTIFHCVLPFIALSVLNCLIAIQVRRAEKLRSDMSSSQRREASVTKMLLCIVIVIGLCYSPMIVGSILTYVIHAFEWSRGAKVVLYEARSKVWCILEVTLCIASASDFVIYYVMGNRFRASLVQILVNVHNRLLSRKQNSSGKRKVTSTVSQSL